MIYTVLYVLVNHAFILFVVVCFCFHHHHVCVIGFAFWLCLEFRIISERWLNHEQSGTRAEKYCGTNEESSSKNRQNKGKILPHFFTPPVPSSMVAPSSQLSAHLRHSLIPYTNFYPDLYYVSHRIGSLM